MKTISEKENNSERESGSSPSFSCADVSVSGLCGHVVPMDAAWIARDAFICPVCFLAWEIEQEKPTVTASGFVMPGERKVVCKGNIPEHVGKQAMASRKFREECGVF